jgi:hypothetical protein
LTTKTQFLVYLMSNMIGFIAAQSSFDGGWLKNEQEKNQ